MPSHPLNYDMIRDVVLEQDRLGAATALESAGTGWMERSARDLSIRSAVEAMHADRKRMAEALRDRVINNSENADADPMWQPLLLRIDEMLFSIADQIEEGTLGITRTASLAREGEGQPPRQSD